jgi:hypothetical protein
VARQRGITANAVRIFAVCYFRGVGCVARGRSTVACRIGGQRISIGVYAQEVAAGWNDCPVRYRAAQAIRSRYTVTGARTGSDSMIRTAIVVNLNEFVLEAVRAL